MTKKYGILAYPAKYSLSPVMHYAAFNELGIDAEYGIFDVREEDFQDFLEHISENNIDGFSVSAPYKELIMHHINIIDEDAKNIGAVNTVLNKGGVLYGYNTDHIGAVHALKTDISLLKLNEKKVVVLGAGGAARAICYGLLKEGAEVFIWNRTAEKAEQIISDFKKVFGKKARISYVKDLANLSGKFDILIQATSIVGIKNLLPENFLEHFDFVMDIVYHPLVTPILEQAKKLGKKIITGERMLLFQAVEQFKIWTEKEAPVRIMREALEKNLI